MKILARINEFDFDMVEVYSIDKTYLFGVLHIDCFFFDEEDKAIHDLLEKGEEVFMDVKLSEKGER